MRRRKIVGRRHCRAGPTVGRSPSRRPRCGSQTLWHPDGNGGTAATFLEAWQAGDYAGMYSLLSPLSQDAISQSDFQARYEAVARGATLTGVGASGWNRHTYAW